MNSVFDGHVTVDCLLSIPFLLYVMCLSTSSPVPSLLYPVSDKRIFQCIPSTPTHPDSMYKSFNPEKCRYVNSNSPYLFFQNQRWIASFSVTRIKSATTPISQWLSLAAVSLHWYELPLLDGQWFCCGWHLCNNEFQYDYQQPELFIYFVAICLSFSCVEFVCLFIVQVQCHSQSSFLWFSLPCCSVAVVASCLLLW